MIATKSGHKTLKKQVEIEKNRKSKLKRITVIGNRTDSKAICTIIYPSQNSKLNLPDFDLAGHVNRFSPNMIPSAVHLVLPLPHAICRLCRDRVKQGNCRTFFQTTNLPCPEKPKKVVKKKKKKNVPKTIIRAGRVFSFLLLPTLSLLLLPSLSFLFLPSLSFLLLLPLSFLAFLLFFRSPPASFPPVSFATFLPIPDDGSRCLYSSSGPQN